MDDLSLYEEILRLKKGRIPSALATVVETSGSTPRKAGAKMLVRGDGSIVGTIGGGKTEADTIEAALEVMRQGRSRTISFSLTEMHGAVCGGSVLIYLEPLFVPYHLVVVGNGHVGRAVGQVASRTEYQVSIIDLTGKNACSTEGEEIINHSLADLPNAFTEIGVDQSTYIFIATSDHQQDFHAAHAALATDACYIGVLGSRKKRQAMDKYLLQQGFSPEDTQRIISPAGLDIGAETPAEIAISVVAQMVHVRRHSNAEDSRYSPGSRQIKANGAQQTVIAVGR